MLKIFARWILRHEIEIWTRDYINNLDELTKRAELIAAPWKATAEHFARLYFEKKKV